MECSLRVGSKLLLQAKEFKYLGVLFTSEGKMRALYRSVVVKRELSRKAKLSIYRSIYVPTLIWPGNASGSPRRNWRVWLGRRNPGGPCLAGCHLDPAPDKRMRMDGWMDAGSRCRGVEEPHAAPEPRVADPCFRAIISIWKCISACFLTCSYL